MLYLWAALIGGVIAIVLVQSGMVTSRRLAAVAYALIGGALGILVLRFAVGGMGLVGGIVGATAGAVLLLYLAKSFGGGEDR